MSRWPVTEAIRSKVVDRLFEVATGTDPEQAAEAVKLLLRCDRVNLDHERESRRARKDEAERRQRLLELASKLPPSELKSLIESRLHLQNGADADVE